MASDCLPASTMDLTRAVFVGLGRRQGQPPPSSTGERVTDEAEIRRVLGPALAAAARNGRRRVLPDDLPAADLDLLATLTMSFLRSRPASASPMPGWRMVSASAAGVLPWWARALAIVDDEGQRTRLRAVRMAVYDLLEDRQLLVKHPGQGQPVHISPAEANRDEEAATTADEGAGYGSTELNALVEAAAIKHVIGVFTSDGWAPDDVSHRNLGWDITFRRGHEERHVEVKGCSGPRPVIILTANEHRSSQTDDAWLLAVVTRALVAPSAQVFGRQHVQAAAVPLSYRVDLS